jgi:Ca-activated chloride channel family protein
MKRSSALVLLLLLAVCAKSLWAQGRPRRVEQSPSPASSAPTTGRAPVLTGGTNSSQGQNSSQPGNNTHAGPEEVDQSDIVRVNTTLVTIPVSVMDREGRYAPNLRKEDFRLWEDGVEQQIAFFQTVDKPFSVVLMIDTSGSTRFKLEEIQDAAIAFVNQLQPSDRVMILTFDDKIRVLTDFTGDRNQLREAIMRVRPGEGTKLYEAVDTVINQKLNRIEGKKAIVLFTDGVDTTSKHATYESTLRDAEELDALIYPVQYDTFSSMGGGGGRHGGGGRGGGGGWPGSNRQSTGSILGDILGGIVIGGGRGGGRNGGGYPGRGGGGGGAGGSRADYELANRYLHELADRSGARLYQGDTTQSLSEAFGNVAEELRRQYSIGYYPKNTAQAGQRRAIRVRVNEPNLAVRARDSYIFNPSGGTTAQTTTTTNSQTAPVLKKKLAESNHRVENQARP